MYDLNDGFSSFSNIASDPFLPDEYEDFQVISGTSDTDNLDKFDAELSWDIDDGHLPADGDGNDIITGDIFANELQENSGDDSLEGSFREDILISSAANNTMNDLKQSTDPSVDQRTFNNISTAAVSPEDDSAFSANELNLFLKNNAQYDVSLNFTLPNAIRKAYLELDVKDADSKSEGELWINGSKAADLFPTASSRNNSLWTTEVVNFDPSLLKDGENIISFKHIRTGGFVVKNLRLDLVTNPDNIKAFPGAEGFGTDTAGGRGGRIFAVTSLADSGPGTLREAIEASGPRMIVFHVGGTIELEKSLTIKNPYITIAGQTAPDDGVQLAYAGLNIATHDVVIRGMRIRPGDTSGEVYDAIDPHGGSAPVRDVVIDHSSLSWGMDENIGLWSDVADVTIQWSIISEGLFDSLHPSGPHSRGILVGDNIKNVAIHHNLFAHNNRRNPELKGGTSTAFINNLLYNWGDQAVLLHDIDEDSGPLFANIIGNKAIAGPDMGDSPESHHLVYIHEQTTLGSQFYIHDNLGPSRTSSEQRHWDSVYLSDKAPRLFRSKTPIQDLETDITIHPVDQVKRLVLRYAGATAPRRDDVDKRIVSDVRFRTGSLIDSQEEVGGWPVFRERLRPDNDNDGLPNGWERKWAHLDPNNPADANQDYNNDGYLNIEDYMNSFFEQPL